MKVRKGRTDGLRLTKNQHKEWLSLLDIYGPFISLDVLQEEFPQGLDSHDSRLTRRLRSAYEEWQSQSGDPAYHREWLNFLMQEVLGFPDEVWKQGTEIPPGCQAHFPQHGETLTPDRVLLDGDRIRWVVQWLPAGQRLDKPLTSRSWVADPIWRMVELLHATGNSLGLVSNGEQFAVVSAPLGEPSGVASFYAELWLEEPSTLQAFRTLFGTRRFLGVTFESGPESLLKRSAEEQHQVTSALGRQVLQAVELLVSELDRLDRGRQGELLAGVDERNLFRAALTVMMRLIFLLSAEERELLPLNNALYQENYAISPLAQLLREASDTHGEEVLTRREDAWVRLLATFRAVYAGVQHEDLHLPAYGGSLFDPDQFPFLEGRAAATSWTTTPAAPLPLHNRLVLYLLESLQTLKEKNEVLQRVSFRALDVEQLGHVYESLLDHTVKRSSSAVLGLRGKAGREPEIELFLLQEGTDSALTALAAATGRKIADLQKEIVYDTPPENPLLRDRCEDDRLYHQILPFQKLLREDAMGHSVIFPPGGAYVTQGSERKESGAHYTPRSLTEETVQHTLDPLVYPGMSDGLEPSPERLLTPGELLGLKVLDMAMGSGAFLVQCCRYLGERLVESWQRHGAPQDLPFEPEARLAAARRRVAESCLFGVDRDPLAVEMAKLSLWLLTLDQQKPFSFLDHALRCGDSLLGVTSLDQLRQLALKPATGQVTIKLSVDQVDGVIRQARVARQKLESFTVVDPRDAEIKMGLLRQADSATTELRRIGDILVAAGLQTAGGKGFDLRLEEMLAIPDPPVTKWTDAGKPESAPSRRPFHWSVEFPEVFELGGFDAVVGNPPFLGGQKLTGSLGVDYREYLVHFLAQGQRGSADLVAYFFLRAKNLLKPMGTLGLVATNTLAQGDTREVGLDRLTEEGLTLYQACASRKWPGGAALEVAQVWARHGDWGAEFRLGGQSVTGITSALTPRSRVSGNRQRLAMNAGQSFIGTYVLGLGFVLSPKEAQRLIDKDARNAEILFPYLNGEDLNSRPDQSPSRWVINFHNWPLERAMEYTDCFQIVLEKVKPERDRLMKGDATARDLAKRWWQFARSRPELHDRLKDLAHTIRIPRVSKYPIAILGPTGVVQSEQVVVVPSDDFALLGILQSSIHAAWFENSPSTLETRLRYTPSDIFETFPQPDEVGFIAQASQKFQGLRSGICLERQEGLTRISNRVHHREDVSIDISSLRDSLQLQDQQVASAYGWHDLDLDHGFHGTSQGLRFTVAPAVRVEILDRLLELNYARYEDEVRQGMHQKKAAVGRARKPVEQEPELTLFGDTTPDVGIQVTVSPPPQASEEVMSDERWAEIRAMQEKIRSSHPPKQVTSTASGSRHFSIHPAGHAKAASGAEPEPLTRVEQALLEEQKRDLEQRKRGNSQEK